MFPLSIFKTKKAAHIPLSMVALSDAPSAQIACDAGIDALLVGDSLGNTALGFDSTLPVTMDMMAHHLAAVVRGVKSSARPETPIIADMPFGSYISVEKGVENAVRLMQLGAHGVKIEGAEKQGRVVGGMYLEDNLLLSALHATGVPVMGHVGFTPQSQFVFGSVVQGKSLENARQIYQEVALLQESGCFAVVLEAIPEEVARTITEKVAFPTIGIGAGSGCDGQVLVWHDLVGISARSLKMAKAYAQTRAIWIDALTQYKSEVESKAFPSPENSWQMAAEEFRKFDEVVERGWFENVLDEHDPFDYPHTDD